MSLFDILLNDMDVSEYHMFLIASKVANTIIANPPCVLSVESHHNQILYLFAIELIKNTYITKMPVHGFSLYTQVYLIL